MGPGQRWIELRIPSAETRVVLFTPAGHDHRIGSFVNLSFCADGAEKTAAELSAFGVEFIAPPKEEE